MKRKTLAASVLGVAVLFSAPLFAHHGNAALDTSKKVVMKAVVTDWLWQNPHSILKFDVKDDSGNVTKWSVEMTAPNHLVHYGWNGHKLHAGQAVKVTGHAAKNGVKVLNLRQIFDADGKEIPLGPPPQPGQS